MAIAMMVDNPEGSQEGDDAVREQLGLEKPAGGIFHVAGPSAEWRVTSDRGLGVGGGREAVRQGGLLPAFEAAGSPPPPPQFWPVHNYMA